MAHNIVNAMLERFAFNSFEKISPNFQKETLESEDAKTYVQAAVTATLAGMYKYASTEEGSGNLFNLRPSELLDRFFEDHKDAIIQSVSDYGKRPKESTAMFMEKIAEEGVHIVREQVGEKGTPEQVRSYITGQRHHILVYLPPDLHFGELIDDNSLDDRTNKMEGPVSGLMHFFEQLFAEKDEKKVP